jgi:hypothetical protein
LSRDKNRPMPLYQHRSGNFSRATSQESCLLHYSPVNTRLSHVPVEYNILPHTCQGIPGGFSAATPGTVTLPPRPDRRFVLWERLLQPSHPCCPIRCPFRNRPRGADVGMRLSGSASFNKCPHPSQWVSDSRCPPTIGTSRRRGEGSSSTSFPSVPVGREPSLGVHWRP